MTIKIANNVKRVTAFNPATLSPHLWYDPSDLTTLFQVSDGTTAVTADGDPVGYMANKGSGASMQVIQATSGSRPLYKTTGGFNFLLADGVDDLLTSSGNASTFMTSTEFDMMLAFQFVTIAVTAISPDSASIFNDGLWANTDGDFGITAQVTNTRLQATAYDGGVKTVGISGTPFATATNIVARFQLSGGTLSLTINNGTPVTTACGALSLGLNFPINIASNFATQVGNIEFFGWIARKTVFSGTEANSLWTWLGAKCGLTL